MISTVECDKKIKKLTIELDKCTNKTPIINKTPVVNKILPIITLQNLPEVKSNRNLNLVSSLTDSSSDLEDLEKIELINPKDEKTNKKTDEKPVFIKPKDKITTFSNNSSKLFKELVEKETNMEQQGGLSDTPDSIEEFVNKKINKKSDIQKLFNFLGFNI